MVTCSRKQYFRAFAPARETFHHLEALGDPVTVHVFTPSSSSLYVLLMYFRVRRLLSGWISQAMICEKARTYARRGESDRNNFGPG